ncbi:MAG: hypothetical protein NC337_07370 [Roseburia sp.]|nr:hypothetical protein [Roseburia sp.]
MTKSNGGKLKTIIIVIILVMLVGGYYFYLSNKEKTQKETQVSTVQDILLRNLETNYPPTPKEVVKYFSDISKCVYNESYTDEELQKLADKLLGLYDDELAENNPRDQYIKDLQKEVRDMSQNGYSIVTYTPSASTDVQYDTIDGREYAKLYCTYSVKKGVDYVSSRQVFVLRRETATGHWKILGFEIADDEVRE